MSGTDNNVQKKKRRISKQAIASIVSFTFLACSICIYRVSFKISPRTCYLSFDDNFHISVISGDFVFFNDRDYGPYRGSIVGLAGSPWPKGKYFGETLGIYYRHFLWRDGSTLWTLAISLWYPIILFSITPTCWFLLKYRRGDKRRQAKLIIQRKKIETLIIVFNLIYLVVLLWESFGSITELHPILPFIIFIVPLFNILGAFDVWKCRWVIIALVTNFIAYLFFTSLMLLPILGGSILVVFAILIFTEIALVIRLLKLIHKRSE